MTVTIRVTNFPQFKAALEKDKSLVDEGLKRIIAKAAIDTQREAVLSIQRGPKTGRVYRKRGGRTHRSSAKGQAPASDTGTLAKSIKILFQRMRRSVIVKADTQYARRLEEDLDRPFMIPAAEKAIKGIASGLKKLVNRL